MDGLALLAARDDDACPKQRRALFGLSLCAGAGGLDLGLHLALPGYRTVCYVERESFAASTLVARMEDAALDPAPVWDDIKTFKGKAWRGLVDILHGGYPCQPFSVAGKKLGDKDPRHLWPDVARIVREIKPPICFFENVGGHLRLGFEQVHDDLQRMGYRVKAGLFTAEEVGAPHKRERLFILAYRKGVFGKRGITEGNLGWEPQGATGSQCCDVADRNSDRLSCRKSKTTRKDDPQGRTQCPSHAEPCRNNNAAGRFSLHEAGSGKGEKRKRLQGSTKSMANAKSAGARQYESRSRGMPERDQQSVANPSINGLQGTGKSIQPMHSEKDSQRETSQSFNDGTSLDVSTWPPTPNDYARWERTPASLKPSICRMADGMACRVDRLRTCGNGVVPLAAAYAFCTLATQAITENGTE